MAQIELSAYLASRQEVTAVEDDDEFFVLRDGELRKVPATLIDRTVP